MEFEGQFNPEGAQKMLCAFSIDGFDGNNLWDSSDRLFMSYFNVSQYIWLKKCNLMMEQIKNHQFALFSVETQEENIQTKTKRSTLLRR